jgi:hypothetical protein
MTSMTPDVARRRALLTADQQRDGGILRQAARVRAMEIEERARVKIARHLA